MGREIRRVPPNWEHPREADGHYLPLYDESFESATKRWKGEYEQWEQGGRQAYKDESGEDIEYWEYNNNPPDRDYYRPHWEESERTWYQVYQTVSEGSPVTPPFATKEELIDYLVANGDFWDQRRGVGGWTRENAESFVGRGWAPSLVVANGRVADARDQGAILDTK